MEHNIIVDKVSEALRDAYETQHKDNSHKIAYCETCGKRIMPSWKDAQHLARKVNTTATGAATVHPYYSRKCGCVHLGGGKKYVLETRGANP